MRIILRIKSDIKLFCTKKAARVDRSDASAGLTFLKNGGKETRTPDPLHAMQVLNQLNMLLTTSLIQKAVTTLELNLEHSALVVGSS